MDVVLSTTARKKEVVMDFEDIARLIKRRRKELGLTQEELARRIGISRVTLSKMENVYGLAEVKLSVLINLLRELGYELDVKRLSKPEGRTKLWTSEELWDED